MFENIGSKIKGVARVFFIIGCIISVLAGFILMTNTSYIILGYVVILVGILLSWLSTILLYGIGQLVENSDICAELMSQNAIEKNESSDKENEEPEYDGI